MCDGDNRAAHIKLVLRSGCVCGWCFFCLSYIPASTPTIYTKYQIHYDQSLLWRLGGFARVNFMIWQKTKYRAIWRPHTARLHKRIRIFTSKEIRKCTRKHNLFIPNVFRDLVCLYAVCDMWFTYGYTHCGDATRKPKTIIAKSLRGFDDKNVQTFWFYSVSVIQSISSVSEWRNGCLLAPCLT